MNDFDLCTKHEAKAAATRFLAQLPVTASEGDYADLLDDITAEYAIGKLHLHEGTEAFDAFVQAMDEALRSMGAPHPYERNEA